MHIRILIIAAFQAWAQGDPSISFTLLCIFLPSDLVSFFFSIVRAPILSSPPILPRRSLPLILVDQENNVAQSCGRSSPGHRPLFLHYPGPP